MAAKLYNDPALQAKLDADPELQAALKQLRAIGGNPADPAYAATDAAVTKAITRLTGSAQLPKGYKLNAGTGQIEQDTFLNRHGDTLLWALPTAGIVGGAAVGAMAGGGAAAGGAAAGTTAGTTAATTTAATTGFGAALKAAGPALIGGAANLGGAAIAAHSNTEAAKIQAESADKALAQAKEIWQTQRADEAPYRQIGTGALGLLGQGMGINMTPPPAAPAAPAAPPANGGTMSSMGPPPAAAPTAAPAPPGGTNGLVSVRNPQTGLVHLIPQDQVAAAQQRGGQVLA